MLRGVSFKAEENIFRLIKRGNYEYGSMGRPRVKMASKAYPSMKAVTDPCSKSFTK